MVSMSSSRNAKTVKHKASHIPRLPRQATDLYQTQSSPQPLNICIQSFSVPCWNNKDDCIQLRLADLCQDCHGILKTILSDTYTFFSLLLLLTYIAYTIMGFIYYPLLFWNDSRLRSKVFILLQLHQEQSFILVKPVTFAVPFGSRIHDKRSKQVSLMLDLYRLCDLLRCFSFLHRNIGHIESIGMFRR